MVNLKLAFNSSSPSFFAVAFFSFSHWFAPCCGLRMLLCLAVKLNLNLQQVSIHVLIIELGEELASSIMSS